MASGTGPVDMSKELAALQHEKKNQSMKKLPSNASVQRRPLSHPAIAPPQAASHVQKVVYVSCRTPVISAVKRVKKLLQHVEKRALQGIEAKNQKKVHPTSNLVELSDKLAKSSEEILVKASGRAMEQALRVGEWFKTKETEYMCNVEIRTGSVAAVDDIVIAKGEDASERPLDAEPYGEETTLEGGDTTMDLLGDDSVATAEHRPNQSDMPDTEVEQAGSAQTEGSSSHKRRRKKRKRAAYDEATVPEARIRWIKTVEVAISLKA